MLYPHESSHTLLTQANINIPVCCAWNCTYTHLIRVALGLLVESGPKQPGAERQHCSSGDQSDQPNGSKHLVQPFFLDKLCYESFVPPVIVHLFGTCSLTPGNTSVHPKKTKRTWNMPSDVTKILERMQSSLFSSSLTFTKQFSSSAPWQQDYV